MGVKGLLDVLAAVLLRFLYSLIESDFLCEGGVLVVSVKGGGRGVGVDTRLEFSSFDVAVSSSFRF